MDSFLDQQRERGALDSSGGFSVNPFKALAKMAAFQSQDRGFYLLRLVQTGVVLESSAIEIVLGRDEVSVTYREPKLQHLDPRKVEMSFGKPASDDGDVAFSHFMNGLNHALTQGPKSLGVVWVYSDGTLQTLRASEETFTLESSSREEGPSSLQVKFGREHDARQIAAETHSVHNRCACSPVPVLLDGQNVVTVSNPESSLYRRDYTSGFVHGFLPRHYNFGEHYLLWGKKRGRLALPKPAERKAQFRTHSEDSTLPARAKKSEVFVMNRGAGPHDGFLRVTSDFAHPGTVSYIQAGVVLSKESLQAPGVRAFLCVDGFATDLSGSQLIGDVNYLGMREYLRAELSAHLTEILTELEHLKARFDWTIERKIGALGSAVLTGAYMWSGLVLLPVPVLGKAWAMGMLASTGVASHLGLKSRNSLDEELRNYVRLQMTQGLGNQKSPSED